jgi:repressor LexA
MRILTKQRQNILDFIADFITSKGYSPSVRDIAKGCGIGSATVAQYHLNVLEKEGYIRRDSDVSRSISLTRKLPNSFSIPLLGTIAAGEPIPVPDADTWTSVAEDSLDIPSGLVNKDEKTYALKVKGTSMIDALIDHGDIVIVRATNTAKDGSMICAWLEDRQEVTLKRIYYQPGMICLKPENKTMEPIYCSPDNIEIQGEVIGVIRKVRQLR